MLLLVTGADKPRAQYLLSTEHHTDIVGEESGTSGSWGSKPFTYFGEKSFEN